jgi:hypothetical protein
MTPTSIADSDDEADEAALVLALERTRRAEPETRAQVAEKLEEEGWRATAEFCASLQQSEALQLRPWQQPPCDVDPDSTAPRQVEAVKLLRRMLAAGVSRWHPDPLAAVAEVERKRPSAANPDRR